MVGKCGMLGDKINAQRIVVVNLGNADHLEDLSVDVNMMIKWVYIWSVAMMWIEFGRLRRGTSDLLLWTRE